ncbi:hypothetical protein WCE37_07370 [Luteimonas sp. MJ250]|uniref:hypothetical protein n=1 Tax=Luteimonas sp. MJ250 TaxID=3129236 RepID=UPI0031BBC2CB
MSTPPVRAKLQSSRFNRLFEPTQDPTTTMHGQPPPRKLSRRALTPAELLARNEGQAGSERTAVVDAEGADAGSMAGQQGLLDQFKDMLQQEGSLGYDDRDELARVFEQALQDSASSSASTLDAFDSATWRDTVDMLLQGGLVEQDEADHLVRSLNDALAPLQRRESRLAMEFSRRVEAEGQEKALEWFREASTADQEPAVGQSPGAAAPDRTIASPLRGDTVNSRSRRLRGPPKQGWT